MAPPPCSPTRRLEIRAATTGRPVFRRLRLPREASDVEVDGGQHAENPCDEKRDAALTAFGYRVIRVWNHEVLTNIDGVLEMLLIELGGGATPHPDR
jgi:hypothetical protein